MTRPDRADMLTVREQIAALGIAIETAWVAGDVLRTRMLLGHLHQHMLRAMTYLDDDLDDEVANG